jgi:hypothetical protein
VFLQATCDHILQPLALVALHQARVVEIELGLSMKGARDGARMGLYAEDDVRLRFGRDFSANCCGMPDGLFRRRRLHVGPQKAQIELDGIEGFGPHALVIGKGGQERPGASARR